jgi:hypothetical protein
MKINESLVLKHVHSIVNKQSSQTDTLILFLILIEIENTLLDLTTFNIIFVT